MLADNINIDQTLRRKYLQTLQENYIYQRIGLEGPDYYENKFNVNFDRAVDCCPKTGPYRDNHTDYIWEYRNNKNRQLNEVIKHLLHTITNVAFAFQFQSWDWNNPNSELNIAMNEAIDKGIYNISDYREILDRGDRDGYKKVTTTEFAYWRIAVEWGFGGLFDLPHSEFKIRDANELVKKLPLSHKLYEDTVKKILNPPDVEFLKNYFK